jgi:hypothetical protein
MGESDTPSEMRRYTVRDAADILGITTGATRNRLSRGTLQSVKEGGTVYVLLPAKLDTPRDAERDAGDTPTDMPGEAWRSLLEEMRGRTASLERQLEQANERDRENRRIIAALTQRIPAIEAPAEASPDAPGPPETATEQPGRVEPQASVEGSQTGAERVSWWRRLFGA